MKQTLVSVISNDEIMPDIWLMWLECPQIASVASPGQFIMVRCERDSVLRRPLSIHQLADKTKLALLFNVVGKGTRWLSERKVGESLDILGPLGNSYSIQSGSRNLLLVAGGIGIAPLQFLSQEAVTQGYSVTLLLGVLTASQLYPEHLLPSGVQLFVSTEDGSKGRQGMVTELLPDFIEQAEQVFACGPLPMYHDIYVHRGKRLKDKSVQISLETRMGCGFGVCYGCTVATTGGLKQVCEDGPVFDLNEVLWDKLGLLGH